MRSRLTRLRRIANHVAVAPIRSDLVDAAFERFRATSELPEHERVALAVIQRAQDVRRREEKVDLETGIRGLATLLTQIEAGELPPVQASDGVAADVLRRVSAALPETDVGPPVPETSVLIAEAKRYVELATELGLVTADELN